MADNFDYSDMNPSAGDLVVIKPEYLNQYQDPDKLYEVTDVFEDTKRCFIKGVKGDEMLDETLVSFEMITIKRLKKDWKPEG